MRTIANYMTKQPWSVQIDDSVTLARRMLAERRIHHLPVLDGGKLVGIVTESDLVKSATDISTVGKVMTVVEEVDASAALGDALEAMSERERDAVVVTRDGSIEGIFTAMDAVRVLRQKIRSRRRKPESARHGRAW
jgi:acetoin utilization protein AcuB